MAVDPEEFKRALRKFASGITVVTVALGDQLHGMTASSFASVSIEPPLILVCLHKTSRTRALVIEAGTFAVNVLSADQEGISRAFSSRGVKPFRELTHKPGVTGAPLLDGAIAWIECRITEVTDAGDHDIVLGDVLATQSADGAPLVYFDRTYTSLREA